MSRQTLKKRPDNSFVRSLVHSFLYLFLAEYLIVRALHSGNSTISPGDVCNSAWPFTPGRRRL